MQSNLSLSLLPGRLWPGMVAPDRVLSMGRIYVNCVLMLMGIIWNNLNVTPHQFGALMLNWITWNTAVFDFETVYLCLTKLFEIGLFQNWTCVLMLNWIVWNKLFWYLTACKQKRKSSNINTKQNCLEYNCLDIHNGFSINNLQDQFVIKPKQTLLEIIRNRL